MAIPLSSSEEKIYTRKEMQFLISLARIDALIEADILIDENLEEGACAKVVTELDKVWYEVKKRLQIDCF